MNFYVTDFLNQQIEEAMMRLGIGIKAEFFRMLALHCVKEVNATSIPKLEKPAEPEEPLDKEEKIVLSHLQRGPKTINELVVAIGLPVQVVSASLVQLLLKRRVLEQGSTWEVL